MVFRSIKKRKEHIIGLNVRIASPSVHFSEKMLRPVAVFNTVLSGAFKY